MAIQEKAYAFAPMVVTKYQKRISGPRLDRIDMNIEVPRVDYEKLSGDRRRVHKNTFNLGQRDVLSFIVQLKLRSSFSLHLRNSTACAGNHGEEHSIH